MPAPLLKTKFYVPAPRPELVIRPGLIAQVEFTLSNYCENGDVITVSVKASNSPAPFTTSSAIVDDGKIQILTLK